MLRDALGRRSQLASGVFHEELPAARRDIEVARFRADDGPSILVSTEAGGEGRNFEFCHRLVLFDLPWKPSTVEQRIGRLDRIGRRMPVRDHLLPAAVRHRRRRRAAVRSARPVPRADGRARAAAGAHRARDRGRRARLPAARCPIRSIGRAHRRRASRTHAHPRAAYHQLHREPYHAALGPAILARVPPDLDALIERVVVDAASRLGFRVEQVRGRRTYAIEFGNEALVDSLPGRAAAERVGRHLRSRVRRGRRDDRLLRLRTRAGRRTAGALRGRSKGRVGRLEIQTPGRAGTGSSPSTRTARSSTSGRSTATGVIVLSGPMRFAVARFVR